MDARKGNIYEILNGNKQFIIPVYQRYYNWEKEQCERLWNDIIKMQKNNKVGHFVGSIVNIAEQAMPTGVQKYMIIDGQQRMTTLTLLLIALRNYSNDNPDNTTINAKRIDNMLLKNEYESGEERYKLLLTETDKDIMINLVEQKPIDICKRSRIIANYQYFYDKIKRDEIPLDKIYESIGKLEIVNITLDRAMDDAQAIFESLNSTGKELSESDLIRNYVLMDLDNEEQLYVYEHLWRPMELLFDYEKQSIAMDRFFRDYLTLKLARIPKINRVYEEFKMYNLNCEFDIIRDLCKDVYKFATYYTNIIFSRNDDSELVCIYKDINNLKMEVSYPFLLKVHDDESNGIISSDELKEIMQICISYVFRRGICDIPTNSLNKTFATLKNEIRTEDYINSIKAFFVLREDYKEFPNDERFINAFLNKDIYNMRSRNFLFSHLENYKNKAEINIQNYTIEHIMPQNNNLSPEWKKSLGDNWKDVQKRYIHNIGNLTLTAYNSEMSDKSFIEKMDMDGGFKESALRLNKYVIKQMNWNENNIKERAKLLADKAINIWAFPNISEDELLPYINIDKNTSNYDLNNYNFNELTKKLFDTINKRILNLSPDVRREFKKKYIAYKIETNFVDIVVQAKALRISLNIKFSMVNDIYGICNDITNIGRWGNGDVELFFRSIDDIDKVMEIIKQSYDIQACE